MKTLKESLLDDFGSQAKDLRKEQIKNWIEKNNDYRSNFKINDDHTIDIDNFKYKGDGNFPDFIQFNKCKYVFYCNHANMTSLRGCPKEVGGIFDCSNNRLKTLNGGPKEVGGNFYCYENKLTSLKGSPEYIKNIFNCSHNKLKSFKDGPRYIKNILYVKQNDLDPDELQWIRENIKYFRLFA